MATLPEIAFAVCVPTLRPIEPIVSSKNIFNIIFENIEQTLSEVVERESERAEKSSITSNALESGMAKKGGQTKIPISKNFWQIPLRANPFSRVGKLFPKFS